MFEQLIQIGADFIEAQGMMAFVVVVLAVLMYRDQTNNAKKSEQQAEENKRQAENFTIESKQQGEILKILRAEVANNAANVANNAAMINKVDQLKNDLITEAQSIADASTLPLKNTMDNIMDTVTPLEQAIRDMQEEIRQMRLSVDEQHSAAMKLVNSVDNHLASSTQFRTTITAQTEQMQTRLSQLETVGKSTEEKPKQGDAGGL